MSKKTPRRCLQGGARHPRASPPPADKAGLDFRPKLLESHLTPMPPLSHSPWTWRPRHHHARPPPHLEAENWPPRFGTLPAVTQPPRKSTSMERGTRSLEEELPPPPYQAGRAAGGSRPALHRRSPWATGPRPSSRWSCSASTVVLPSPDFRRAASPRLGRASPTAAYRSRRPEHQDPPPQGRPETPSPLEAGCAATADQASGSGGAEDGGRAPGG